MADSTSENLYGLLRNNPGRVYVIAQAGLNHGGSKERALTLLRAAKWAGADAVEFDTLRADPSSLPRPTGRGSLQALSKKLELSHDIFRALLKEAQRLHIDFISTPFDEESTDFLDKLGVSAFKIVAGDITDRPLIQGVSRKAKPVLLSTEMSTEEEIEKAIHWMHTQSNDQAILLHGASSCPAEHAELNLKSLEYLRDRFGLPIGFSDQTIGSLGATVAVSLGAQVIERHFVVEARGDVPDLAVSMDTKQLKGHIAELRTIETILGTGGQFSSESGSRNRTKSPSGLHVPEPVAATETIDAELYVPRLELRVTHRKLEP